MPHSQIVVIYNANSPSCNPDLRSPLQGRLDSCEDAFRKTRSYPVVVPILRLVSAKVWQRYHNFSDLEGNLTSDESLVSPCFPRNALQATLAALINCHKGYSSPLMNGCIADGLLLGSDVFGYCQNSGKSISEGLLPVEFRVEGHHVTWGSSFWWLKLPTATS